MMSQTPRGLFFVMVGPGGAGKNTIMNSIKTRHPEIKQLATATTRPMRLEEQQGREHHFVSLERFREMIANNELLEYQEVTAGRFYGIIRATVENSLNHGEYLIADIEETGASILRETYADDTVLIFITVPGSTIDEKLTVLRQRMEVREEGDLTEAEKAHIRQRLERARDLEFPFADECDIVIVNDDIDAATNQVEKVILNKIAERSTAATTEGAQ